RRLRPRWRIEMQSARVRVLLALGLCLTALPSVKAQTTPYEEVLFIEYGSELGRLDTTSVHSDDPYRTLVESMQVMSDSSVWILPRTGGALGRLEYADGAFVARVPFEGFPRDFLVTPEGIYSWASSGRVGFVGRLAFDPGQGDSGVVFADLLASD